MLVNLVDALWGATAQQKEDLATQLEELGKMTSVANKVVLAADGAMGKISKNDLDLMQMNLEELLTSEEAEVWGGNNPWHFAKGTNNESASCLGFVWEGGEVPHLTSCALSDGFTQVSLNLTRNVKFSRLSVDGGITAEILALLSTSAADTLGRLGSCARLAKVILLVQEPRE